jgi:hypothetical protein
MQPQWPPIDTWQNLTSLHPAWARPDHCREGITTPTKDSPSVHGIERQCMTGKWKYGCSLKCDVDWLIGVTEFITRKRLAVETRIVARNHARRNE